MTSPEDGSTPGTDGSTPGTDGSTPGTDGGGCTPCGPSSCCSPSVCTADAVCAIPMDVDAGTIGSDHTLCGRPLGAPVVLASGSNTVLSGAVVGAVGDGTFAALWGQVTTDDRTYHTQAARSTATGTWTTPTVLGAGETGYEWHLGAVGDRQIGLWLENSEDGTVNRRGVWTSELVAGTWSPTARVGTAPRYAGVLHFDASDAGAVAVWESEEEPAGILAAVHGSSAAWDPTVVSPTSSGRWAGVAVGPAGDAMAVWHWYASPDVRHAYTVYRPAGGAWQAPVELNPSGRDTYRTDLAVLPDGSAVALWQEPSVSPGVADTLLTARFDTATGWSDPELLETVTGALPNPTLELDETGFGFAIWNRADSKVAVPFEPASGFGSPMVLVVGNSGNVALDVVAGRAFTAWTQSIDGHSQVLTSCYTAETGWNAPVRLDSGATEASAPAVALDTDGAAVVVWRNWSDTASTLLAAHLAAE